MGLLGSSGKWGEMQRTLGLELNHGGKIYAYKQKLN